MACLLNSHGRTASAACRQTKQHLLLNMVLMSKQQRAAGWWSLSGSEHADNSEHLTIAFENLSPSLCSFQEPGVALIMANVFTVGGALFSEHRGAYQTLAAKTDYLQGLGVRPSNISLEEVMFRQRCSVLHLKSLYRLDRLSFIVPALSSGLRSLPPSFLLHYKRAKNQRGDLWIK